MVEEPVFPPGGEPTNPSVPSAQACQWAMLSHLTALIAYLGVPIAHIAGPLIVWLMKRETDPFVDAHGKESVNFQISTTIYSIVAGLLCFVLVGIPLLAAILIGDLILVIIASIKAKEGKPYRYPFNLRLIR